MSEQEHLPHTPEEIVVSIDSLLNKDRLEAEMDPILAELLYLALERSGIIPRLHDEATRRGRKTSRCPSEITAHLFFQFGFTGRANLMDPSNLHRLFDLE